MNYDKRSFLAGLRTGLVLGRDQTERPHYLPYLTFSRPSGEFTIHVFRREKLWDGTLYYSTDAETWVEWDGAAILSSSGGKLYIRGSGNSVISGPSEWGEPLEGWVASAPVDCTGNIETLLDYEIVERGGHPVMGEACFADLFMDFPLLSAPDLPAVVLSSACYKQLFSGCTELTIPPSLPAKTLAPLCYSQMFDFCENLVALPYIPATTMAVECCDSMFYDCQSIMLSATQDATYQFPYRIPKSGTGVDATNALRYMFDGTGGTFTGTPTINTPYYTNNPPV